MQKCQALSALMTEARSAKQKQCSAAGGNYATPLKKWKDVVNLTLHQGGELTKFAKAIPSCWDRTCAHELYEMRQFIKPAPPPTYR